MFDFESNILCGRMLVCLEESMPDVSYVVKFSDPLYYNGKTIVMASFDSAGLEEDATDEELGEIFDADPVDAYEHRSFLHRLAMEYISTLVLGLLSDIVEGQIIDGRDIRDVFETRDNLWNAEPEVWDHAANQVKYNILKLLER